MPRLVRSLSVSGVVSLFVLATVAGTGALAPLVAPLDPNAIDTMNLLALPSPEHLLGTDELGRDLLSRLIYGARISLSVALTAVIVAAAFGIPLGVGTAFAGRSTQFLSVRMIDLLIALPEIFIAILILSFLGGSLTTLVGTIGFLYAPQFARVSYSMAVSIRAREHVQAAISLGAGPLWVMWHEVLPNIRSIIAVQASFTFSFAMLMEAGLSFLGFGVRPPTASWGQMIGTLKDYLYVNPLPVLAPCLVLFAVVLAVNVLGDRLQDVLNPELRV